MQLTVLPKGAAAAVVDSLGDGLWRWQQQQEAHSPCKCGAQQHNSAAEAASHVPEVGSASWGAADGGNMAPLVAVSNSTVLTPRGAMWPSTHSLSRVVQCIMGTWPMSLHLTAAYQQ